MPRAVVLLSLVACRFDFDDVEDRSDAPVGVTIDAPDPDAAIDAMIVHTNVTFSDFTICPSTITMQGNASCVGGLLEITPDLGTRQGQVWITAPFPVKPAMRFSFQITAQIGTIGVMPADGMVLAIQADPRGEAAVGGTSGGLLGFDSITPSLGLEIDPYENPANGDPPFPHIGFDRDGSLTSVAVLASPIVLTNNTPFTVWFDYDGPTTTASAYIDQTTTKPTTPLFVTNDDLSRLGAQAWFGLTAATGFSSEYHHVLSWQLDLFE